MNWEAVLNSRRVRLMVFLLQLFSSVAYCVGTALATLFPTEVETVRLRTTSLLCTGGFLGYHFNTESVVLLVVGHAFAGLVAECLE